MAGDNGGSWWNPIDNITAQAGNLLSGAVTSLSSGTVQPNVAASQTAYEGANYYNPATGNMETYTNGQWVPGNGVLGDTTSGTYTGGTYDPQAAATSAQNAQNAAYYDQQIGNVNSGMGRLDNQATIGHQNVLDSYNNAYNTLLGQKQSADTSYQNQKN